MPVGRPSDYTPEMAQLICYRISEGESLRVICLNESFPCKTTVFKWLGQHREFAEQYARARETQMDAMAEEILDIADDSSSDVDTDDRGNPRPNTEFMQRSKLRVDTRKWLMGKLAPKKYGDRTVLAGDDSAPLSIAVVHVAKSEE